MVYDTMYYILDHTVIIINNQSKQQWINLYQTW